MNDYDPVARDIWLTDEPELPYLCHICGDEVNEEDEYQGSCICDSCLKKYSDQTESE